MHAKMLEPMTVEVPTDGLTVRFVQHIHPQAMGPSLTILRARVVEAAKAWADLDADAELGLMAAIEALKDAERESGG